MASRYIVLAATAALLAGGPGHAQPHPAAAKGEASTGASVQAWDTWNLKRRAWAKRVNRLNSDFSDFLLRVGQGPRLGATGSMAGAWRARQLAAYQAIAADAERLGRTPAPAPGPRLRTDPLARTIAAADPEWLKATTSGVVASGDDVRRLIDLSARASQGDEPTLAAARRQMWALQIRLLEMDIARAKPSFSTPDDPSRDFSDWRMDMDHGLIVLLQATIDEIAPQHGTGAAAVDRKRAAAEIRGWADAAERSLAKQSADARSALARLKGPSPPAQQAQAQATRATMLAFEQARSRQQSIISSLRGSAQTLETATSTSRDWLLSYAGIRGWMVDVAEAIPTQAPPAV